MAPRYGVNAHLFKNGPKQETVDRATAAPPRGRREMPRPPPGRRDRRLIILRLGPETAARILDGTVSLNYLAEAPVSAAADFAQRINNLQWRVGFGRRRAGEICFAPTPESHLNKLVLNVSCSLLLDHLLAVL